MTAINFPDSPTSGQIFTSGDISWRWNSLLNVWEGYGQVVMGPTGPAGLDGEIGATGATGPTGAVDLSFEIKVIMGAV